MIISKEVVNWMGEVFQKIHNLPGLHHGPQFVDCEGKKYPVFGTSQVGNEDPQLIVGIDESPFNKNIPLSLVILKKDRSALTICRP